jgi:hypothetical protein
MKSSLLLRVTLRPMAVPASANGEIVPAILIRDARRLAEEMERLHSEFERTGALLRVRKLMALHSEGNSQFDMLDAAKNLRSYAGLLTFLSSRSSEPDVQPIPSKSRPRHTPYVAGQTNGHEKITTSRSEPQRNGQSTNSQG